MCPSTSLRWSTARPLARLPLAVVTASDACAHHTETAHHFTLKCRLTKHSFRAVHLYHIQSGGLMLGPPIKNAISKKSSRKGTFGSLRNLCLSEQHCRKVSLTQLIKYLKKHLTLLLRRSFTTAPQLSHNNYIRYLTSN